MNEIYALGETQKLDIPTGKLSDLQLQLIRERLKDRVDLAPAWSGVSLTGKGWVGQFPIGEGDRIVIRPKAPTTQIFRMLEVAYDLEELDFPDGAASTSSIEELFESLAYVLAQKTLRRVRAGIHREYVQRQESLVVARGRILPRETAVHGLRGAAVLECEHEEQSADISHNRIIAWVLHRLSRGAFQNPAAQDAVSRAYRALSSACKTVPHTVHDCDQLQYHRMNADYRPIHALCRFFLEHAGATGNLGDHDFLPFAISMPRLFERFVFRWLDRHLGPEFAVVAQHNDHVGSVRQLSFKIDVLIRDAVTGQNLAVLDTKYKVHAEALNDDVYQISFYAHRTGAPHGILVYPIDLAHHQAFAVHPSGPVTVRTMTFEIGGNLAEAGARHVALLRGLLRPLR